MVCGGVWCVVYVVCVCDVWWCGVLYCVVVISVYDMW